jgi:hypothetical protein
MCSILLADGPGVLTARWLARSFRRSPARQMNARFDSGF